MTAVPGTSPGMIKKEEECRKTAEKRITRARSRSPSRRIGLAQELGPLFVDTRDPAHQSSTTVRRYDVPVYEPRSRYRSRSPTLRQTITLLQRRPQPAPAPEPRTFAIPVVSRAPSVVPEQTRLFPAVGISSSRRVPGFVQLPLFSATSAAPSGPLPQIQAKPQIPSPNRTIPQSLSRNQAMP